MSDPISFDAITPRLSLPLLFAGQAQKEAFVNEFAARTDALLHCAIEGVADTPPATPQDGENWLIGSAPSGEWSGHAGELALRQSGNWLFAAPRDGMRLLDRSTGQEKRYRNGWQAPARPALPTGGATIDTQARDALAELVAILETAGIIPPA